jgi:GDSL-like Lipase/Acylhydrolase family
MRFPNGGTLLAPPPSRRFAFEFLSESSIMGYGVESPTASCPMGAGPETHNARKSLPQILSDRMDADLTLLGYSGKGITRNAFAPDTNVFGILFERALPTDAASLWTFTGKQPDIVFSILGGQDYSEPGPADPMTFRAKYTELVKRIRTVYPRTKIVLGVGPQIFDVFPAGYNARTTIRSTIEAIAAERAAAGDSGVSTFLFDEEFDNTKLTGCYYHPGPAMHQELATKLEPHFRRVLGL